MSEHEKNIALREGYGNDAADGYFKARADFLDTIHNRKIFEHAFARGWDARVKIEKQKTQVTQVMDTPTIDGLAQPPLPVQPEQVSLTDDRWKQAAQYWFGQFRQLITGETNSANKVLDEWSNKVLDEWFNNNFPPLPVQPEQEAASIIQAITDPENQPSQYGTVTLDYHFAKLKKWEDRFEKLSNRVLAQPPLPVQREWVELTTTQKEDIMSSTDYYNFPRDLITNTQAKLKEENT